MQDIYVVGIGMTPFGKFRDKTIKAMTGEAVAAALSDAGVTPVPAPRPGSNWRWIFSRRAMAIAASP